MLYINVTVTIARTSQHKHYSQPIITASCTVIYVMFYLSVIFTNVIKQRENTARHLVKQGRFLLLNDSLVEWTSHHCSIKSMFNDHSERSHYIKQNLLTELWERAVHWTCRFKLRFMLLPKWWHQSRLHWKLNSSFNASESFIRPSLLNSHFSFIVV